MSSIAQNLAAGPPADKSMRGTAALGSDAFGYSRSPGRACNRHVCCTSGLAEVTILKTTRFPFIGLVFLGSTGLSAEAAAQTVGPVPAVALVAAEPGAHFHNGFYLRLATGFGAYNESIRQSGAGGCIGYKTDSATAFSAIQHFH